MDKNDDNIYDNHICCGEEKIMAFLTKKFPSINNELISPRKGRIISPPLNREQFGRIFDFATEQAGFTTFHLVIGVDDGDDLGLLYVLSNEAKIVLILKQSVPKNNPVIKSICSAFPNALWYERELVDLFGVVVNDLPPGPTYPLPDGWPEGNYPLRKEWHVECFNRETMEYTPEKEADHE